MAQLLYERHSTNVHLNTVKRHMRLCRQVSGAEEFATAIDPFYNGLVERLSALETAKESYDLKRDIVILKDTVLDDEVRNLADETKKFERNNPGQDVKNMLFPNGQLSKIIYAPLVNEPSLVEKIIVVLQSFNDDHPLKALVESLQAGIDASKLALKELSEAIETVKLAEAYLEIAKTNLRAQYELNYFSAGAKFGKRYAGRLFPSISTTARVIQDLEEVEE